MWSSCSPCLTVSVVWWRKPSRTIHASLPPETKSVHNRVSVSAQSLWKKVFWSRFPPLQAYKAVVNDATIFKLELPMKQKGWEATPALLVLVDEDVADARDSLDSVGLKTQPESKCPELLANYCDMLLRKTPLSKKLTSEEIEAKLKEVVRSRGLHEATARMDAVTWPHHQSVTSSSWTTSFCQSNLNKLSHELSNSTAARLMSFKRFHVCPLL